jgi:uncharacterized membrane protein
MDATRIHLFITHLPVFGLFLGSLALVYGLIRKNSQVKIVSYTIILISIVGGIIAFQTGEEAEDAVENILKVSDEVIEEHEESAELTVLFIYSLGLASLFAIYVEAAGKAIARQFSYIVLGISMVTFYFVVVTASLGGKIRHTEIDKGQSVESAKEMIR